jgi:hypothetical protein
MARIASNKRLKLTGHGAVPPTFVTFWPRNQAVRATRSSGRQLSRDPLGGEEPMRASCLCGGIRIEISGKIGPLFYCHCSRCRKASGSAFAANGDVRRKYWNIVSGEELIREFGSSGIYRAFCSRCGSQLYSRRDADPESFRLRLGLLDGDPERRPLAHTWAGSKAPWFEITDGLPQFDLGPDSMRLDG